MKILNKLPSDQLRITLSTKITLLRILLVPIIIYLMMVQSWLFSFILIIISAISDILDGMLARIRNEETILGALLDPIADKFFILSCYFILSFGYFPGFTLPLWFTLIVFFKEFFLILGGIFIYFYNINIEIKPILIGKLAMDVQTIFIIWIFISYFFNLHFVFINDLLFYLSLILVLFSFLQYVRLNLKQLIFLK